MFVITDKEKCFPHFHIDKEIDFYSYRYFSINIFVSYCIVLQNIWSSKNTQYLKYPVISCEARRAVLQKPQIQQGFQDLAKIIPLGAHFVGETLLCLNGSCHAWELHKPAKCLGAWEDPPHPESITLQKSAGMLPLLLHSCCQVWYWEDFVVPCHSFSSIWWNFEPQPGNLHIQSTSGFVLLSNYADYWQCRRGVILKSNWILFTWIETLASCLKSVTSKFLPVEFSFLLPGKAFMPLSEQGSADLWGKPGKHPKAKGWPYPITELVSYWD